MRLSFKRHKNGNKIVQYSHYIRLPAHVARKTRVLHVVLVHEQAGNGSSVSYFVPPEKSIKHASGSSIVVAMTAV